MAGYPLILLARGAGGERLLWKHFFSSPAKSEICHETLQSAGHCASAWSHPISSSPELAGCPRLAGDLKQCDQKYRRSVTCLAISDHNVCIEHCSPLGLVTCDEQIGTVGLAMIVTPTDTCFTLIQLIAIGAAQLSINDILHVSFIDNWIVDFFRQSPRSIQYGHFKRHNSPLKHILKLVLPIFSCPLYN